MTKPRVTELQSVLLASAAKRDDHSLFPTPTDLADPPAKVRTALTQLLKRGLAVETQNPVASAPWRKDGDQAFGLIITDLGQAAIGLAKDDSVARLPAMPDASPPDVQSATLDPAPSAAIALEPAPTKSDRAPTKTANVIALLSREQGATLAELVAATGWLPHTTRAALTGLRKKGHELTKSKRDDATCYVIAGASA